MAFQFHDSDHEILVSIAEHRVLTVRHLTALLGRNASAMRRRLGVLSDRGLIEIGSRPFGRSRGRPENLVSLRGPGVELLKIAKALDAALPVDRVVATNISCIDHELLVNDLRAQLRELESVVPALSTRFFSAMSPMLPQGSSGRSFVTECIDVGDASCDMVEFEPDGVLAITDTTQGRALLYFLEADRGTEPRNSTSRAGRGIRQKIINYQTYFAVEQYKRYEEILSSKLRGFRLLILTEDPGRHAKLCRLVREIRSSEFVWVADRRRLLSEGLWAPIWAPGGRISEPAQSILDRMTPNPCPRPAMSG